MKKKTLSILGSTGSIGTSTVDVVLRHRDCFDVVGLAAGSNAEAMLQQIKALDPLVACLADQAAAERLQALLPPGCRTEIVAGLDGLMRVATLAEAEVVLAAISGSAGLLPTFSALQAGKDVALANKESLVMAGAVMTAEARKNGCRIIPVDSEHSAIYQVLRGRSTEHVSSLILTASGGPFLHTTPAELQQVTPAEALKHPRWDMGSKVTIDSASLMNKGLEVIEAYWLFALPPDRIRVVVHPQSIIHSMVAFVDGTVLAQMSHPDMRGPIAYALSEPERLGNIMQPLDFVELGELTFLAPDLERFSNLALAFRALSEGGLIPTVMNAANEVAVARFCAGDIPFMAMPRLIETVMDRYSAGTVPLTLDAILEADRWARQEAQGVKA